MVERPGENLSVRRQCALLKSRAFGCLSLRTGNQHRRSGLDAADRRIASEVAVLRLAANGVRTQPGRPRHQPQARAKADARDGDRGAGSAPRHQQSRTRPQDLSLSAARREHHRAQSCLGQRHTFRWRRAFCIWWRLSTGPAGRFWRGACRTRWIRALASRRSTKRWRGTARRKYSTPIRALSSRSSAFTGRLEAAGIAISMDGRGRFMDNIFIERLWRSIKYEEVHLKAYADGREARDGIGSWINFYNHCRPHQAMNNQFPMAAWRAGMDVIEAAKTVDMPLRLDNAIALPTYPQQMQTQQLLDLKNKAGRITPLTLAIHGPGSGVHFSPPRTRFLCHRSERHAHSRYRAINKRRSDGCNQWVLFFVKVSFPLEFHVRPS